MKHVSILVPESAVLAAIDDPRTFFHRSTALARAKGGEEIFDIKFVGLSKAVKLHDSAFTVHTDLLLEERKKRI
jgi:hypothetical protein